MKHLITSILLLLSAGMVCAQNSQEYSVKHLVFPEGCPHQDKISLAARLVPTQEQLDWQNLEMTAFLHFGMNTFTGREWGDGKESPSLFAPTDLDAEQWIRTLSQAGFKMAILTAKHHDGFCLWPTKTTLHSVASSPWKDGKGDVVREVRNACAKYGMKFGVYLSPWDRNAPCYGDSPAYNKFFIAQLTELLTDYGEVDEVWFDGANGEGPNGKIQVYDWDSILHVIHSLQPHAVTAIMGDDVRWVGNESGMGRETEWSATVLTPKAYAQADDNNGRLGITNLSKDLGSRNMIEKATEMFWYPSEVDVSIRPGWFHTADQDEKVKSLKTLVDIYFQSVGRNSVLLLNVPPDKRGHIHEADSVRLQELSDYLKRTFSDDRVRKGSLLWNAVQGEERVYKLKKGSRVNVVMLQEDIKRGQRVESFVVEGLENTGWKVLCEGTTIGHKRLVRFEESDLKAIKVRITGSRAEVHLSRVGVFHATAIADKATGADWNDIPREEWTVDNDHPLVLDLGRKAALTAFTYAPLESRVGEEMAFRFSFSASDDGDKWHTIIKEGEFSNIMHNPVPMRISFNSTIECRFIRIETSALDGKPAKILPEEIGVTLSQ